jgi:hypothetical protein
MAVRGSVEDYTEPKLFFSEKALRFVKDVLQLEPKTLALKFEAWCVSGLGNERNHSRQRILFISNADKAPAPMRAPTWNKVISQCRVIIQDGLGTTSSLHACHDGP